MAILWLGPPNRGVECKKKYENRDFRPISNSISETIQYTAI